jgi:predicted phosphoribosyltransferase
MTEKDNVHIFSRNARIFNNREEAGKLLGAELKEYLDTNPVVLGIPRGGIIVAREIARQINAELDIILAHKLRTPDHEELAMGSVTEDGKVFLNEDIVGELDIGESYITREREYQIEQMKHRIDRIRNIRPKGPLNGRIVIVTDDGVATGATTEAALWAARLEGPEMLIAAIPVGPEETIRRLARNVNEMICLSSPDPFYAVGRFYRNFYSVDDDQVMEILKHWSL